MKSGFILLMASLLAMSFGEPTGALQSIETESNSAARNSTADRAAAQAKLEYQESLKNAGEQALTTSSKLRMTLRLRDELIDLDFASDKEQILQNSINQLEQSLENKELLAEPSILGPLTSRRVELMIDIAGLTARHQMAVELLDEQKKSRLADGQTVLDAQRHILKLAEAKLQRVSDLLAKGSVSQAEAQDAELVVATAKLQLVEKMTELERPSQTDSLAEIGLDLAEKKSQLELVERLLKESLSIRSSVAKLSELKTRLNQIKGSRAYGTTETLKEYEKAIAELQLEKIKSTQELDNIKQKEPDHADEEQD